MILVGDVMEQISTIQSNSIDCVVTSPPYWGLRDYGVKGQLGLEETPEQYVGHMRMVFEQVRRVLKPQGTLWLNLGDSYAATGKDRTIAQALAKSGLQGGKVTQSQSIRQQSKIVGKLKQKDLVGIPWSVAFALRDDGWYLRQDIIWHKPNPMPESVRDRCTKAHEYIFMFAKSHEYIFMFAKSQKYYFDSNSILEPFKGTRAGKTLGRGVTAYTAAKMDRSNSGGFSRSRPGRNKRSVWVVNTGSFKGAHFATFPEKLIEPCILAGCPRDGVVLDPFFGSGTVGVVAKNHGRNFIGIELNPEYAEMARNRIGA